MSNKMKLVIKCENCGKYIELGSTQYGQQIHMNNIKNRGFNISEINIEKTGDLEEYEDIDDVETNLNSIRIDCDCGEYMMLEDWRK